MNNILLGIIIFIIYLIGVFVALWIIAKVNKDTPYDQFPPFAGIFSWIILLALVMTPILGIIAWPFDKFYQWASKK